MNRDALTLLGCSGSLALALLTVNPAKANEAPLRELVFEAPVANDVQEVNSPLAKDTFGPLAKDTFGCGCTQENSEYSSLDSASDRTGDLAIETLGCDCAGCRNVVSQMVQQGSLTLPQ
jgi:hypothetical protein